MAAVNYPSRHVLPIGIAAALIKSATLLSLVWLCACEPAVRDRPYGEIRLGKFTELMDSEMQIPRAEILLRRDERGWYAMSLLCTKDLSILKRKTGPNGDYWASQYTDSTYSLDGKVLTGPAIKNLPYYELYIDQGLPDKPRDTLYVRIGNETTPDWRLPVPAAAP